MEIKKIENTNVVFENIKDTPRTAVYLYFATEAPLPYEGANVLLGNLLLQGTDDKTAEDIALELENLGIEIGIDSRVDYLKVSILCLNEDLNRALEIVFDFMTNANFATFDKEVYKFKGEVQALLDSPVRKAQDNFNRELFLGHKYGVTNTKILENIDNMTKEHVVFHYKNLLKGKKIISIAGDINDDIVESICKKLPFMKSENDFVEAPDNLFSGRGKLIKIAKNDAKQAQIFQGWIVDSLNTEDYPKLTVLNNILGASGLSSRLFSQLRDKQGLAYTVRSSYKTLKHAAAFILYIGTEPVNIKKSLDGFRKEIQRMIDEPPSDEELQGAIENYTGKFKYFYTQTNAQIASVNGWNWIMDLGLDYNEKSLEAIRKVKRGDVIAMVKKYLLKEPVTAVLAPEKYLDF